MQIKLSLYLDNNCISKLAWASLRPSIYIYGVYTCRNTLLDHHIWYIITVGHVRKRNTRPCKSGINGHRYSGMGPNDFPAHVNLALKSHTRHINSKQTDYCEIVLEYDHMVDELKYINDSGQSMNIVPAKCLDSAKNNGFHCVNMLKYDKQNNYYLRRHLAHYDVTVMAWLILYEICND